MSLDRDQIELPATGAAPPWFIHAPLPEPGETVVLSAEESRHAAGARRLGPGAPIVLMDGTGGACAAVVAEAPARRGGLVVRGGERFDVPPPAPTLDLAIALPKGERTSTMLGMLGRCAAGSAADRRRATPSPAPIASPSKRASRRGIRIRCASGRPSRSTPSGRSPARTAAPGPRWSPIPVAGR